jgi:FkbM family methyltransferase
MANINQIIRRHFPTLTYAFLGFQHSERKQLIKLLNHHRIDIVFDIGANIGYYAHAIRKMGYKGKIVSFEPMKSAFDSLQYLSKGDKLWFSENIGLGDFNGSAEINVSSNSVSSSLLQPVNDFFKVAPNAEYVGKESIEIRRFDSVAGKYLSGHDNIFLKVDTQGFERCVLDGCGEYLNTIKGVQLELSIVPFYKGQSDYIDFINFLSRLRFIPQLFEPGFSDGETGQMFEFDAIFFRR